MGEGDGDRDREGQSWPGGRGGASRILGVAPKKERSKSIPAAARVTSPVTDGATSFERALSQLPLPQSERERERGRVEGRLQASLFALHLTRRGGEQQGARRAVGHALFLDVPP